MSIEYNKEENKLKVDNVLSAFDGKSCGQIALERANIEYNNYYSYEIDENAMAVTNYRYPKTIQLGNVENYNHELLKNIDLLIGGNPCQPFSFSGKQLAFDDPRSKLFFKFKEMWDIISEHNPNAYFLLENVVMNKKHSDVITEYMGVEPIIIDSALVSAQRRKRMYWTNIPDIKQPEDKNIMWGDIREHGVEWGDMYYTNKALKWIGEHGTRKNKKLKLFSDNDKVQMIEASHHKKYSSQRFFGIVDTPSKIVGRRLNEFGKREDYNKDLKITQCLEVKNNNKLNCITTVLKDNVISPLPSGRYLNVFKELELGKHYRYITPLECERAQTLPDNYTKYGVFIDYLKIDNNKILKTDSNDNKNIININNLPTNPDNFDFYFGIVPLESCSSFITINKKIDVGDFYNENSNVISLNIKTTDNLFYKVYFFNNNKYQSIIILEIIKIYFLSKLHKSCKISSKVKGTVKISDNIKIYNLKVENLKKISKTQRYKMIGNGWTIDVISHIFKSLYNIYV